jgi:elongation factor Ts
MNDKQSISEYLLSESKEIGSKIEISDYVVFQVGEGIEKEETNFAEEVAKTASA